MDSGQPVRRLGLGDLCGIAFLLFASLAEAASPLRIEIDATSFQSRTNGPIPLRLVIHSDHSRIIKGALRIDFDVEGRHLGTYTLEPVVLTPGKQETTLLVSPFPLDRFQYEANVRFTFLGPEGAIPQEPSLLRLPGSAKRTFFVGTVLSPVRRDRNAPDARWLDFENYVPPSRSRVAEPDRLQALLGWIEPDRFPADPNVLTPYDLIYIPGQDLAALDESQTSALLAWVEAGGAAVVQIDETTSLREHHVDLLNGLAGKPAGRDNGAQPGPPPRFVTNSKGRVERGEDPPKFECHRFVTGWGRGGVLIGPMPLPEDVQAEESLRSLLAWIWRLSGNDRSTFVPGGQIARLPRDESEQMLPGTFAARAPWTIPAEFLFPPSIRPVPGWLLATILAVFVLLIGPGDWLLLGAIRRHRWTWILLPLLTLGVTRLVIATSNRYLGLASRISIIEIRDIAYGNRIARTNRLDFHVPAERGVFELTSPSGQIVPFTTQTSADWRVRANSSPVGNPQQVAPDIAVNRSQRKMAVAVERWTPVLFRSMAIHPIEPDATPFEPSEPGFDWDKAGELIQKGGTGPGSPLIESLRRAYGPGAVVECFSRSRTVFSQPGDNPELHQFRGQTLGGLLPRSIVLRRHFEESAPSGSPTFEDLEMAEDQRSESASERDATFVVQVIVREDDRTVIYRRRYSRTDLFGPEAAAPTVRPL